MKNVMLLGEGSNVVSLGEGSSMVSWGRVKRGVIGGKVKHGVIGGRCHRGKVSLGEGCHWGKGLHPCLSRVASLQRHPRKVHSYVTMSL